MLLKLNRIIAFCFFAVSALSLHATHNRAGEITYRRIEPFTKVVGGLVVPEYRYLITVTKYTDHGSDKADRCVDTVYFGDGERGIAPRVNGIPQTTPSSCQCGSLFGQVIGCGEVLPDTGPDYVVKLNTYTITHVYPGPGNYLIRSFDPNRNMGVHNIPNSVNLPFYIESLLIINSFTGANSSPVFEYAPIDRACVHKCFQHNPGAFDPDNDSLSFELSAPRGANGATITGYFLPEFQAGGFFRIDETTGLLAWCNPIRQDEYNVAFIVKEWRKNTNGEYQMIGYVLRDMQILVGACPNNDSPIISLPRDTCVEAGALIEKNIRVTDPNIGNTVVLEGRGGPFSSKSPFATLMNTVGTVTSSTGFNAFFRWQTDCSHLSRYPYQATFKALDNGIPVKLPAFATYNIRIVPPAVKNVTAVPAGSNMRVTWDIPACNPSTNPLTGFKIYRRNDCSSLTIDPCTTGVPENAGFELAGEESPETTQFIDDGHGDGLVVGQNYSYMVIATYHDGSTSMGGAVICARLKRDVPVILNVDVTKTAVDEGEIHVRWTRPLKTPGNFDTLAFPGPYRFTLKHKTDGDYADVFTVEKPMLYQLDTFFVHTSVNTLEKSHDYIVEFKAGTVTVGSSQRATSLFLTLTPNDRRMGINWTAHTPWNNYIYRLYRKAPGETTFSLLVSTPSTSYTDTLNVVNRQEYCYRVESEGKYSDPAIFSPLVNRSQEVCATAVDLTLPCAPTLSLDAECPNGNVTVIWNDMRTMKCGDDVVKYILHFKRTIDEPFSVAYTGNLHFYHYDDLLISGCYAIQSVDSSNNVSEMSPPVCIDNCPEFELPNLFTPNDDGVNDKFHAIKVRQIRKIELRIVDRWGNMVYRTTDPYFKWDGKSDETNTLVSEGTFFYVCDVYEPRLTGEVKRTLKGYLQVAR